MRIREQCVHTGKPFRKHQLIRRLSMPADTPAEMLGLMQTPAEMLGQSLQHDLALCCQHLVSLV